MLISMELAKFLTIVGFDHWNALGMELFGDLQLLQPDFHISTCFCMNFLLNIPQIAGNY